MAQRGVREYDGKRMLARYWSQYVSKDFDYPGKVVLVDPQTDLDSVEREFPWLTEEKLVVKPDQLFGKRGKHGLIKTDATLDEVKEWIRKRMNREVTVGGVTDTLTHFLIEPHVPHEEEFYVAIKSNRAGDTIYFSNHGGVDIESVWDTVVAIDVGVEDDIDQIDVQARLPDDTPADKRGMFADFVRGLYRLYSELGFAFLEINPLVVSGSDLLPLDLVLRVDDTAHFECRREWGDLSFPAPFGRRFSPEEARIKEMDEKSGASLKLTILNPKGRVWTIVAGGGASVIYADTIVDLGYGKELANYGEYSGNPSRDETFEYARTILDLMTRQKDPDGRAKYLLIGGGIANFTDVAKTFEGIIMALREYKDKLIDSKVKIYVRRGGPNYQAGLRMMEEVGREIGVPIEVHGPDTHMTRIVGMALSQEQ
jgi:ATP-citrate lyase beta-subunit